MAMRNGLPKKKTPFTDTRDTRYVFSGLVVCNADGSPRGGVLSPVGSTLVTATATMNVAVARFQAAAIRDDGVVLLANDGTTNVLLDAAPAANSRIDVVYAKQNDSSTEVNTPDATDLPVLGVVKGTAGAVPVKPSVPVGAVELATVLIPSTATATNSGGVVITQTAQFTASAGGLVPFRTKAEMDLWTTAPATTRGVALDTTAEYVRTATAWRLTSSRPFMKMVWAATQMVGTTSVVMVGNKTVSPGLFSAPQSHETMTLTTDTYENDFFIWNRSTGEFKVKKDGRYSFTIRGQASGTAGGVWRLGLTRNSTVVGDVNTIATDGANTARAEEWFKISAPNVNLVTADVVRLVGYATGQNAQYGSYGYQGTALFNVEYEGA